MYTFHKYFSFIQQLIKNEEKLQKFQKICVMFSERNERYYLYQNIENIDKFCNREIT